MAKMSMPVDSTTFRILDANLNRARESLRVMEEYARFVLDDALLTADLKKTRHELANVLPETIASVLMRHRDIIRDVGRETTAPFESRRPGTSSVVVAAGKRLSEALRAIEEYGKTVNPGFAKSVEQIRYQGYELERRIIFTTQARKRFGNVRLYVILTEAFCKNDWYATAEAALRGGADVLQLREKTLNGHELADRAKKLVRLCRAYNALLMINDRPDIAVISGADGVHLGQEDLSVEDARRILPESAIVGVSTHTVDQVRAAVRSAPDYLAVGPIFATNTKPQDHIAGPEILAAAKKTTSLPLVAIGGIDAKNAPTILATAPCCLCVCTAVIAQSDVQAACRNLREIMDQASAGAGTRKSHDITVTS